MVRFEGEHTLVELADAVSMGRDWRDIQGIAYVRDQTAIATPARPLVEDLDQLPYPERNYEPDAVLGRSIMPILASRGCARTCSFCSIHTFYRAAPGKMVRTRKPAEVVREMLMLHEERGITIFLFQDDDFPLFGPVWRRWANEFVDELHRKRTAGKGHLENELPRRRGRARAVPEDAGRRALPRVHGARIGQRAGTGNTAQADHGRAEPRGGRIS